jgi:adenylylsulfate reductase subunit A
VSGPEDLAPKEYFWGYENMSTAKGLFCAGDASGASSHKFSSGSCTEGRMAGKSAVRFLVKENPPKASYDAAQIEALKERIYKPLKNFEDNVAKTTQEEVNPNYILPKMFMMRLQKLMDEYAGGVSAQFTTSEPNLNRALELLGFLKEDAANLGARDLHELMRCWENYHRMYQAEAHVRSILFREETRWPGYYFRSDKPKMDDANWRVFVNCKMDPATEKWTVEKVPIISLFKETADHELLGG